VARWHAFFAVAGIVSLGALVLMEIGALRHQLKHAPGSLVFPAADGSQRSPEADPQKVLRTALARAGLVEGYEHVCRWCGHKERHADNEQRYCPKCLKRTNGTGKPLAQPRGRALWPKAIPRKMRFHDLRHTTATLLLRAGVDAHRVQRLLRHRDVRTTTTIYGHLDVEDLRAALEKLPQLGPNWVQTAQSEGEPLTDTSASLPIVYRLCERDELAHVRVSNAIRIPPSALIAYLEHRQP
jgi:hypothetical protein